jgi:hypothetical protein
MKPHLLYPRLDAGEALEKQQQQQQMQADLDLSVASCHVATCTAHAR